MKDLIETLEEYANGFTNVIAPPEEDVKELLEHIYNQDKEIEILTNELESANESITWWQNRFNAVERDNGRLNNIINELEKYINKLDEVKIFERLYVEKKDILDKIKELKEKSS